MVCHGGTIHSMTESETCNFCLKLMSEYLKAKKSGKIDKFLKKHYEPQKKKTKIS